MSKRFTDSSKWRQQWFRTLPIKAKLTWIYLSDECDFTGVWDVDLELASFQLGFSVTQNDLMTWFGDNILFFNNNKMLIVPFYELQYGGCKDNWNAKIKAKSKLENLGFVITDGKLNLIESKDVGTITIPITSTITITGQSGDSPPTVVANAPTRLLKNNTQLKTSIEKIYLDYYPRKEGKSEGVKKLCKTLSLEDLPKFEASVKNYARLMKDSEKKFIKHFSTFASCWLDYVEIEASNNKYFTVRANEI